MNCYRVLREMAENCVADQNSAITLATVKKQNKSMNFLCWNLILTVYTDTIQVIYKTIVFYEKIIKFCSSNSYRKINIPSKEVTVCYQ